MILNELLVSKKNTYITRKEFLSQNFLSKVSAFHKNLKVINFYDTAMTENFREWIVAINLQINFKF